MSQETKHVHITFPSGNEYKGEWSDDKQNGFGIMNFANLDRYEGGWKDGNMVNGKFDGVGRMVFSDHTTYEGQWQVGVRCGDGVAVFPNGDVFHGLWQQDKMLRGVYSLKNGDKYDGELVNGKFEGFLK